MGVLTSAATVLFLCACGTGLTLYTVHIQRSRLNDTSYRALCDVDNTITCSQIIAEDRDFLELLQWVCDRVGVAYNDKLNPHQPAFRITFFPLLCFLGCLPITFSYFVATLLSSVTSLVSAYLLYLQFQVHNQICLPCTAGYFIHMLLFLVLTLRWVHSGSGADTAQPQSSAAGGKGGSQNQNLGQASRKQKGKNNEHRSAKATGGNVTNASGNIKLQKRK